MRDVFVFIAIAERQLILGFIVQVDFLAENEEGGIISALIFGVEFCILNLPFLKKDEYVWQFRYNFD